MHLFLLRTVSYQGIELVCRDYGKQFGLLFESIFKCINQFLTAAGIRYYPDSNRKDFMLTLFSTGAEILVVAFAFVYYNRKRLGVQIDFDEPSVLVATVVCYGEKVWLELQIAAIVRIWTPAFRFPFHSR